MMAVQLAGQLQALALGRYQRGTSLILRPAGLHLTMAPKLHLRFQGLNVKSRANYRRALHRFFAFLKREGLCIPDSVRDLDSYLGEFMNESFQEGDSPGYAGAAVSALKRFLPRLRSRLYTATQRYSNWIRVYKPCRATPIPWHMVQAMAGVALSVGQRRLAIALLIQFLFFLRTSEIHGLRPRDVSCLRTGHVVVALPHTKTSQGRAQSVSLYDPFLCRVLPAAMASWSPSATILDSSLQAFRARFQKLVCFLGMEEGTFLPYAHLPG